LVRDIALEGGTEKVLVGFFASKADLNQIACFILVALTGTTCLKDLFGKTEYFLDGISQLFHRRSALMHIVFSWKGGSLFADDESII
jgi:hypothetical protein